MNIQFEKLSVVHAREVMDIFNDYIENSFAAYPEDKLPDGFFGRLLETSNGYPAFAVKSIEQEKVIGFCLLRPYNPFPVFKETAEVSYFISPEYTGMGIGKKTLALLEHESVAMGIKNLLAGISSKNEGSLRFHLQNGFVEYGRLRNVGRKKGVYFDVVWMGKILITKETVR